jgi:hypothetical protein
MASPVRVDVGTDVTTTAVATGYDLYPPGASLRHEGGVTGETKQDS